jgi:hypothetical protein
LAYDAFVEHHAQVKNEKQLVNLTCLLFACMGFNAFWYVLITATHTHLFCMLASV